MWGIAWKTGYATINATRLQISDTNLKFPQGEWKFAIHIMEKVKRHSNLEELRLKSVIRIFVCQHLDLFRLKETFDFWCIDRGGSAHKLLIRGNRVVKQIFHCRKFRGPRLYIHNATSDKQEPRVECEIGHQSRKIVLPLRLDASEKLESRTTTLMSRLSLSFWPFV